MGSKPSGISASRGAAILGLNQYQTQFEIWQIIIEEMYPGFNSLNGYIMPEPPDNAAIRWGLAFEDAVCRLAEEKQGLEIVNKEKLFSLNINLEVPKEIRQIIFSDKKTLSELLQLKTNFITCHIDGRYSNIILHEGKTTSIIPFQKKWGEPGTEKVPREYQVQCQHQMACTGAEEVILSVLVFPKSVEEFEKDGWTIEEWSPVDYMLIPEGAKTAVKIYDWARPLAQMGFFHQYHIKRNQSLIDSMIDKYTEFWKKNIIEKSPPEPFNIDDIKRMAPDPKGTIILPENLQSLYSEYKLITSELGESGTMAQRKEQLKVMILDAARKLNPVMDDESTDKWLFYDTQGNKIGSYGKDKRGFYVFR